MAPGIPLRAAAAAGALLGLAACGDPALLPIPRFTLAPAWLCEGSGSQSVRVDATASRGADGGYDAALTFQWSFVPAPVGASPDDFAKRLTSFTFASDAPVQVELEVTDGDGRHAATSRTLGLTLMRRFPCAAGCEPHEICVELAGEAICVDPGGCASDADCGCLSCLADAAGIRRCVAP